MEQQWTTIIKPKAKLFDLNLKEVWHYRDLIMMFVKRDFATLYKQTILGPLWIIINPLFTTVIYNVVFGGIASIPTDGIPSFLFYMAGNTVWTYFAACLNKTSTTFTANSSIFGKVYFPRLVMPISTIISGIINFFIQFVMFIGFMFFFMARGSAIHPNVWILITPILLIQIGVLGMGFGIIISSLTTKYRDLAVLVTFGVQLWMYASPVVYPISQIPAKWSRLLMLNPMAPVLETFRYAYLGSGQLPVFYLVVSMIVTLVVLLIGIIIFNRVEKTFMDTV